MQIRNSTLVLYETKEYIGKGYKKYTNPPIQFQKKTEKYTGKVTKGAAKRIRTAVELMLQMHSESRKVNPFNGKLIKHRLSFVTLTISNNDRYISAKECHKKCLAPFLDWFRKTKGINTYIWKAERQRGTTKEGIRKQSEGQLHYHLTIPSVIHYKEIQDKWNFLQKKAGYLETFYSQYKHYEPNSTDIHKVYKIKNIEAYLVKYISKEDKERKSIEGKVWDCSTNLKGKKLYSIELNSHNELQLYNNLVTNNITEVNNEYCYFIKCNKLNPTKILDSKQLEGYRNYINSLSSNSSTD